MKLQSIIEADAQEQRVYGTFDRERVPVLTIPTFENVANITLAVSPDCSYRMIEDAHQEMSVEAEAFTLQKQELARRIARMPGEVTAWRNKTAELVDMGAHFSQLRAIELLLSESTKRQQDLLAKLAPDGDADAFMDAARDVVKEIIRGEKTWDYFRDKLDLRYSPEHTDPLWVADTVAWDCYRPVLDEAVVHGIISEDKLREPPLIYCVAGRLPVTWTRGERPKHCRDYDLGKDCLPIPVIEVPWSTLSSGWEFLAIHHEVGHDIDADLDADLGLCTPLTEMLDCKGVPWQRIDQWRTWQKEVFADLCALRLAGPAFGDALASLLMLRDQTDKNLEDPHPPPYLRIRLCAEYARTLGNSAALRDHANALETRCKALYGASNDELDKYIDDFPIVYTALMDTAPRKMKNHTVGELIEFCEADDARIRDASGYFQTGKNTPAYLRPRHVPSAARIAIDELARSGAATADKLTEVHGRIISYVKANAPSGLRGGGSEAHEQFIISFIDRIPL